MRIDDGDPTPDWSVTLRHATPTVVTFGGSHGLQEGDEVRFVPSADGGCAGAAASSASVPSPPPSFRRGRALESACPSATTLASGYSMGAYGGHCYYYDPSYLGLSVDAICANLGLETDEAVRRAPPAWRARCGRAGAAASLQGRGRTARAFLVRLRRGSTV